MSNNEDELMTRTVYLDRDERWPVYELRETDSWGNLPVDLPSGEAIRFLARYRHAKKQWDQVQYDLSELWHANDGST